jgi:hypothetical protein
LARLRRRGRAVKFLSHGTPMKGAISTIARRNQCYLAERCGPNSIPAHLQAFCSEISGTASPEWTISPIHCRGGERPRPRGSGGKSWHRAGCRSRHAVAVVRRSAEAWGRSDGRHRARRARRSRRLARGRVGRRIEPQEWHQHHQHHQHHWAGGALALRLAVVRRKGPPADLLGRRQEGHDVRDHEEFHRCVSPLSPRRRESRIRSRF